MKNTYKVEWSPESRQATDRIIDYLETNWSSSEVKKFLEKLKNFEEIISQFPNFYPESTKQTGLRRAIISKHYSVIYFHQNKTIFILYILDNRSGVSSNF